MKPTGAHANFDALAAWQERAKPLLEKLANVHDDFDWSVWEFTYRKGMGAPMQVSDVLFVCCV